jgi:molybdopterin converting factor small subunit
MSVEVRVPTILRSYTGGQKVVTGTGDTIAELLTDLDAQFPGLRGRLVTEDGSLHKFVNVYINDEDVRFLGALDAKLNDGDAVTVLPGTGACGRATRSSSRPAATPASRWPWWRSCGATGWSA